MKMIQNRPNLVIRVVVLVTFISMVVVNVLANTVKINGVTTGQVSEYYKNLFTPAWFTFSIWGLIYLLLAGYTVYQMGFFRIRRNSEALLESTGVYFTISSVANIIWLFMWHYHLIAGSMMMMVVILICLIRIVVKIKAASVRGWEKLWIKLPFSIYFGWITVATVANAAALLVSLKWNRFGLSEELWTIIIVAILAIIGSVILLKLRDMAYGLVLIWAYAGILTNHLSQEGFSGKYPGVITAVVIGIAMFVISSGYVVFSGKKGRKHNYKLANE